MAETNAVVQTSTGSLIKTGEGLDIEKLPPELLQKANEIAGQVDLRDSQAIITYGVGAQRDISNFADAILNQVRTKDSGYVGTVLNDLVINIKELDVDSLSGGGSVVSKIPLIGSLVSSINRFVSRYEKLSTKIEKIVESLDTARIGLLKDIALLDSMFEKNIEYLEKLDLYIAAGKIKLRELNEKLLPELKSRAEASKDPADAQGYRDAEQAVNRFEKKIHDLQLSRMIAIQTSPQIRLIQNGDQTLVEKIQSSILNTIPLWKNQIVIALTLFRQDKALQLQKKVTDTTNELLQKNSELLKAGTIEIAKESERGIVEIETLKKVNNDLISTIEETIKIQEEGKIKRRLAEQELSKLEGELKEKLVSAKGK